MKRHNRYAMIDAFIEQKVFGSILKVVKTVPSADVRIHIKELLPDVTLLILDLDEQFKNLIPWHGARWPTFLLCIETDGTKIAIRSSAVFAHCIIVSPGK